MWSLVCLCTKVHVHKQIHLRNARHLRWGKLFAHTLLKCWLDTLMSSSFPLCNSSSYQPFTSDFCPAGTCTSSVSGCTPPYVSIRPCNHLVPEKKRGWGIHTFQVLFWEVSTLYLCTISPLHMRKSLWVLVLSCTNPRHSYTKCMRMRRSLWCLQNRVDEAKTNTKQLLCALLANGE